MAERLSWASDDPEAVLARLAEAVLAGEVVALPTETVYGLGANVLDAAAVERLAHAKGRPEDKPMTLAVGDADRVLSWGLGQSLVGQRLARRGWPGPLTLVFPLDEAHSPLPAGEDKVRKWVCPQGWLGVRIPDHEAVLRLLDRLPGPLVLTSANRSGEPDAITADQVVAAVGDRVPLVLDDGPTHYGRPSSVVRVEADRWQLLREGVVSATDLERWSARWIVFICTGNTCRSPMAEAFCKKLLAERLGCQPEELPRHGFYVRSAGMAAMMGERASPEAVEVAGAFGADLSRHLSQPLLPELAAGADVLIALARSHLTLLDARYPDLAGQARLLDPTGGDVPDPIGEELPVYRECAEHIYRCVEGLVAELVPS
ncbi:MAG: L-threonylcarbamoyladenylate synthase [Gemmataceae bacterium]|nr:L-threonylcarbamoyladenylate synthase [Gemmataceae bacterium]MDW8266575.1 L-threonylcarbamoyladenylate synthase [Gemmataceae bacterium]